MQQDKSLMIFPEGARTVSGKLQEFKPTFAILSSETDVPVIPVAIKGAYDVWPPDQLLPKFFKKMSVKFYPPVYPDQSSFENIKEKAFHIVKESVG